MDIEYLGRIPKKLAKVIASGERNWVTGDRDGKETTHNFLKRG